MVEPIISFPYIGKEYTQIIKSSFENLGLNIQLPPKTSGETIKKGVKNSADMICYPYKITLGNFMEALDNGVNILLMYDSQGQCRFRHYYKIQEFTLRNIGYKNFKIYGINGNNLIKTLKELSGKSYFEVIKEVRRLFKKIKEHDDKRVWSEEIPNVGIIGEIYSAIDETVNYGIEAKIRKYGVNPYNYVTLSAFLNQNIGFLNFLKKEDEYLLKAKKYFNGEVGGHIVENIADLLKLVDRKADGIIHILPLSCMPETLGEPIINKICSDNNIPLLRIPIDENNSEANLETRIETFCELIKWKK